MRGLVKVAVSAAAGVVYGLLFAQKSGKKFRSDLKNAKQPAKLLLAELKKVSKDSGSSISEWAKDSEELQQVLATGKEQFDALVKAAASLGDEAAEVAERELETLSRNAQTAADKLKKALDKKAKTVKKTTTKATKKVKKATTKAAKTVKKTTTKAKKKVQKAKKGVKTVAKKATGRKR